MQRADGPDIKRSSFFQHSLHLGPVLSDNTEIVAAGFACPAFRILHVKRAEFAESVRAEQNFLRRFIGHEYFRPVHHRREDKGQGMTSERQCLTGFDLKRVLQYQSREELRDHFECLGVSDNGCGWIFSGKGRDRSGVVRFHMLDDQVIRRFVAEDILDIGKPFIGLALVDGVHDGCFFITDDIGIIGHSKRNMEMPLEQIDLMIIGPDVINAFRYLFFHR